MEDVENSEIIFVIGKEQSAGIAKAMVSICNAVYRRINDNLSVGNVLMVQGHLV